MEALGLWRKSLGWDPGTLPGWEDLRMRCLSRRGRGLGAGV